MCITRPPHLAHERGDDAVELGGLEALAGSALAQLQEILTAQGGRGGRGAHHQSMATVPLWHAQEDLAGGETEWG